MHKKSPRPDLRPAAARPTLKQSRNTMLFYMKLNFNISCNDSLWKNQQMHWIQFLLVSLCYMFRAAFLPIIRSSWPYIGFGTFYAVAARSRMELQFHPTPGSKRSQLHKMYQSRCTAKNSWWWAERLPETCRLVIPIKLEFSASVGFIDKESVTMHGHTIVKLVVINFKLRELLLKHKVMNSCFKSHSLSDHGKELISHILPKYIKK